MAFYPHDSCHFLFITRAGIQNDAVIFKCVVLLEYVPVLKFNLRVATTVLVFPNEKSHYFFMERDT